MDENVEITPEVLAWARKALAEAVQHQAEETFRVLYLSRDPPEPSHGINRCKRCGGWVVCTCCA